MNQQDRRKSHLCRTMNGRNLISATITTTKTPTKHFKITIINFQENQHVITTSI